MFRLQRTICIIVCLVLIISLFTYTTVASSNDAAIFTDVGTENPHFEAIATLSRLGVVTGYDDGLFLPDAPITRAEFTALISRITGFERRKIDTIQYSFSDVNVNHWAHPYITYAYSEGYVNGMGDNTFAPDSNVTYEQAVKIVVNAFDFPPPSYEGEPWFSGYLTTAQQHNLLRNIRVEIGNAISRKFVAQLIYNAAEDDLPNMESEEGYYKPLPESSLIPAATPSVFPSDSPDIEQEYEELKKEIIINKLIVIDPGHGAQDPGAIGYCEDGTTILEKDVNLDIALRLNEMLKAAGVPTLLTRETDIYLTTSERAEMANEAGAVLFLSIHSNSFTSASANGTETYYTDYVNDAFPVSSQTFAEFLQEELVLSGGRRNRGVKLGQDYIVIKNSIMPSVLIEAAFLSNPEERDLLASDEFRQKIAEGLFRGIMRAWETVDTFDIEDLDEQNLY